MKEKGSEDLQENGLTDEHIETDVGRLNLRLFAMRWHFIRRFAWLVLGVAGIASITHADGIRKLHPALQVKLIASLSGIGLSLIIDGHMRKVTIAQLQDIYNRDPDKLCDLLLEASDESEKQKEGAKWVAEYFHLNLKIEEGGRERELAR